VTAVLLAGATGLVGQAVLDHYHERRLSITTVGRRATERVSQEVISDFASPISLSKADVAICALGTTIASAGSKDAFRAVDHHAVLAFARSAQASGVDHFIVVTAVGANPKAGVFYSRVKGDTENDLEALGFKRLDIAQPGLLLGGRSQRRPVETLLQTLDPMTRQFLKGPLSRYAGIPASTVGRALLALCDENAGGVFRHENQALRHLSNQ